MHLFRSLALFALLAATVASLAGSAPPKHGGLLFASGIFDVEFVMASKSHYALYFNDASGEELPASIVSDVSLSVDRADGPKENLPLKIDDSGESWLGSGALGGSQISHARVSYRFRGKMEQADIP